MAGVWLALGPGRAVSKKFRFYPWMQQCSTVASAILVWFICLVAAVINLARSDLPWSHLPTTNAIAFAYNVAVLLSLPVLWMPKAAALTRSLQAKHERVTTLHSLISANSAPWCAASRPLHCTVILLCLNQLSSSCENPCRAPDLSLYDCCYCGSCLLCALCFDRLNWCATV